MTWGLTVLDSGWIQSPFFECEVWGESCGLHFQRKRETKRCVSLSQTSTGSFPKKTYFLPPYNSNIKIRRHFKSNFSFNFFSFEISPSWNRDLREEEIWKWKRDGGRTKDFVWNWTLSSAFSTDQRIMRRDEKNRKQTRKWIISIQDDDYFAPLNMLENLKEEREREERNENGMMGFWQFPGEYFCNVVQSVWREKYFHEWICNWGEKIAFRYKWCWTWKKLNFFILAEISF